MKYTLGIYAFAAILSLVLTASAEEAKYEYAFDTSGAPELAERKGRRGAGEARSCDRHGGELGADMQVLTL